ncbi:MAG TPA: BON domain-containing protein, partial [Methanomicrobiales archaeon]|nr:BON domain-containing protein [Methanomicrobiales archaeon]
MESQLEQRVVDHLTWDPRIDATDVGVRVDQGHVVLTGTVPTYGARMVAERDASSVRGVTSVENRLAVQPPASISGLSDERIRLSIERLLSKNPDLDPCDIRVTVNHGVVFLDGSVSACWKRRLAEDIASRADGVLD